jgi:hypothetical protein
MVTLAVVREFRWVFPSAVSSYEHSGCIVMFAQTFHIGHAFASRWIVNSTHSSTPQIQNITIVSHIITNKLLILNWRNVDHTSQKLLASGDGSAHHYDVVALTYGRGNSYPRPTPHWTRAFRRSATDAVKPPRRMRRPDVKTCNRPKYEDAFKGR